MKAIYETSAAAASQLPPITFPETAFIGRSNVGKSSLLNALLNHKTLARKSRTPGRTQMANFFRVNDRQYFVDLPGYGYSSTANREHDQWQALMDAYLSRPSITHALFLWDPRRDLEPVDYNLLLALSERAPLIMVFTKCDKLSKSELQARLGFLSSAANSRGVKLKSVHAISSLNKQGILALREELVTPAPS